MPEKPRLINSGLRFGWINNEDDWNHTGVDLNWQWIDALMARTVIDISDLPTSAFVLGSLYIDGTLESTLGIKLALRVADLDEKGVQTQRWDYLSPTVGMEFFCVAKNTKIRFDGAKWVASQPISISFFAAGLLTEDQMIAKWKVPVPFNFVVRTASAPPYLPYLAGAYASCETATTGAVTIQIRKNGNAIGTIKFVAGSTAGVVELGSSQPFEPGDDLSFVAPTVPDETMSGLSVTMSGNRRTQA